MTIYTSQKRNVSWKDGRSIGHVGSNRAIFVCVGPRFAMDPNNLQIGVPRTRGNRRLTRVTNQISRYFNAKNVFLSFQYCCWLEILHTPVEVGSMYIPINYRVLYITGNSTSIPPTKKNRSNYHQGAFAETCVLTSSIIRTVPRQLPGFNRYTPEDEQRLEHK